MSRRYPANKKSKELLLKELAMNSEKRIPISFYKYVRATSDLKAFRNRFFTGLSELGVFGRIYLADEGVNAQVNVPEKNMDAFRAYIDSIDMYRNVPFKIGLQDGFAFWKLTIKIRPNIVADGLTPEDYDVENVGTHLTAQQWNEAMNEGAIVVDMRNAHESDIGHFKGAHLPQVETFREELQTVKEELKDKKEKKILLYCTGGIRCEKASAFLKHEGFTDVNQLHGGIIDYAHQVRRQGLENKFVGKNFVFDARGVEEVTPDELGTCYQCTKKTSTHVNCKNDACHALFLQCSDCNIRRRGACSLWCQLIVSLPVSWQKRLRKGKKAKMNILRRTKQA